MKTQKCSKEYDFGYKGGIAVEKELTAVIKEYRDERIEMGLEDNPRQIILLAGIRFSEEVKYRFSEPCELLGLHHFYGGTLDDFFFLESKQWDEEALLKYGSPSPMPLDMMNEERFSHHQWIYYNGKHYDVECPTGVENFFDLPFMKEEIDYLFNRNRCDDSWLFFPDL